MNRLFFFLLATLPWQTLAAAEKVCAPAGVLKVVMITEAPGLPPNHFYAVPKTLYRSGDSQGRIEEALNPETGIHLLVVMNAHDLWMANLATGKGKHSKDNDPTSYFRARLFNDDTIKSHFIRSVEIGCEIAWMKAAGATEKGIKHPTLGQVEQLDFVEGQERLRLYRRADKPLRIELYGPNGWIVAMNYLSFESVAKSNPKLFTEPAGVAFEEVQPGT